MNLMLCRKIHLELIFQGYQKTGIPLIEYYDGSLMPFSAADDMGLYVLIPKLASLFSLTIEQTVFLFFSCIISLSWLFTIISFFLIYPKNYQKIISFIGISLLIIFTLFIGDTYIFYVTPTIALVAWSLYFFNKPLTTKSLIFYFSTGFIISLFHYIRAQSCLPALFFVTWLILTNIINWKKKIMAAVLLSIGLVLPTFYFKYNYKIYSNFIKREKIIDPAQGINNHLIWHSIYAGLGFLSFKNPENISWSDSCATEKAQSINPAVQYNTVEYEKTLKFEILRLIKQHPIFIIMTIFAKLGILLLYLFVFANFGLIAALIYPKKWQIEAAFWGAIGLSSLFPLLVLPIPQYSLSFIAFATLYGITSINQIK